MGFSVVGSSGGGEGAIGGGGSIAGVSVRRVLAPNACSGRAGGSTTALHQNTRGATGTVSSTLFKVFLADVLLD